MSHKKGLIILDIDNTLIDTKFIYKEYTINYPKPDIVLSKAMTDTIMNNAELAKQIKIFIYKRPHLTHFLNYIFEHFYVGIWTAATESWMKIVLNKILNKYSNKFLFKWHREHATPNEKYMKPLTKIFEIYPIFNSSNTLIIDDNYSTTKIRISHLHIDRFEVLPKKYKNKDDHLKLITRILKQNNFDPRHIISEYLKITS